MANSMLPDDLMFVLTRFAVVAERWVAVEERREERLAGRSPPNETRNLTLAIERLIQQREREKAERIAELNEFLAQGKGEI